MMNNFGDRLAEAVRAKKTPAMVGIDPRPDLLPADIVGQFRLTPDSSASNWAEAVEAFCRRVLDVVAPHVPVVKFQSAFFELFGSSGVAALEKLLEHAHQLSLITILDAKRGDIGTTSAAYAESVFGSPPEGPAVRKSRAIADAVTVSPYLGKDSVAPFVNYARAGQGVFVLVRTSNPGSSHLQQMISSSGVPIYRTVAGWVREWSVATRGERGYGAVGAVVGATAGDQIAELRDALPFTWLLVPGYGAQGAKSSDLGRAFDEFGLGAIVNNSREIMFPKLDPADSSGAWDRAVESAVRRMIDDLARNTPAGRLGGGR